MSCYNHIPENDQKVACKKVYNKRYYAENEERILARQKRWRTENVEIFKTRRRRGMKLTRNDSSTAREPIVNRTRNTSEITEDNTVKTTGNGSTNIGDAIMPRIKKRSGKDFVTKTKKNSSEYRPFWGLGPRV